MKRAFWYVVLTIGFSIVVYSLELLCYQLNRTFIEANETLPFLYQTFEWFHDWNWKAFALALACGLAVTLRTWLEVKKQG